MNIVILGGGESGTGAAVLAKKQNYSVFLSDAGTIPQKYKEDLIAHQIDFEENTHSLDIILAADEIIKSPGLAESTAIMQKIRQQHIPVVSEIEFVSKYTDAIIVGITGSNGKTTTTMLVNHILNEGGLHLGMAGNIGDSYAKMVAENNFDYYVLEISSFQLDGIKDFRPHIAIITNITPDHLDRYDYRFENYIASKFRITMNQTAEDYFIYDADDEVLVEWLTKNPIKSKLLPFSLN